MRKKMVVITGASAGIGLACAKLFAKEGFDLALGARRVDRLSGLRDQLLAKHPDAKIFVHALDVCDQDSVEAFKEQLVAEHGQPNIIVNNAGLAAGADHLADSKEADWQAMIDTNITGLLRFTQAFLPEMIGRQSGQIINIGSISGHDTYAGGSVYTGTKHAVRAISKSLRIELLGKNIRVNMISPGMVDTEFSIVRLRDEKKAKQVYKGFEPLHALDIANCVLFAAQSPAHVNIDDMIVMPTNQASVHHVHRE